MENKIKLNNALVVKKSTISKLQESQMANIKGGIGQGALGKSCYIATCWNSCNTGSCSAAATGSL